MNAADTLPPWQSSTLDAAPRESSTRLASERPTVPPPHRAIPHAIASDIMVSRIHLGPSVDEVLYRLSLGDLMGASLANEELEPFVPSRHAPPIVVASMQLDYVEECVLASVDGTSTWGDILDASPFAPRETLHALCELVDKGAITLSA